MTSSILGTLKKKGMGTYLRHALKTFVKISKKKTGPNPRDPVSLFFEGILRAGAGQKAIGNAAKGNNAEFKGHFTASFDTHKDVFIHEMNMYVLGHPVKLFTSHHETETGGRSHLFPAHHLPQHSDINALARVVVLMSEPEVSPSATAALHTTLPLITGFTGAAALADDCQ